MSCFNRRVVSSSAPLERLPELASRVCALAQKAGEKIMRFYHNGVSVTLKAEASPLTGAGVASHAFLVKGGGVYSLDGQTLRYGKPGLKNPAIITVGDTRLDWRRLISNAAA